MRAKVRTKGGFLHITKPNLQETLRITSIAVTATENRGSNPGSPISAAWFDSFVMEIASDLISSPTSEKNDPVIPFIGSPPKIEVPGFPNSLPEENNTVPKTLVKSEARAEMNAAQALADMQGGTTDPKSEEGPSRICLKDSYERQAVQGLAGMKSQPFPMEDENDPWSSGLPPGKPYYPPSMMPWPPMYPPPWHHDYAYWWQQHCSKPFEETRPSSRTSEMDKRPQNNQFQDYKPPADFSSPWAFSVPNINPPPPLGQPHMIIDSELLEMRKNSRICEQENCSTTRHFGWPGDKARFCFYHKKPGMFNLSLHKCIECNKTASFGYLSTKKKEFCNEHKKDGTINLSIRKCIFPECDKTANYGDFGDRLKFCRAHKMESMKLRRTWKKYIDSGVIPTKRSNFAQSRPLADQR